jgi:hypothetical protein
MATLVLCVVLFAVVLVCCYWVRDQVSAAIDHLQDRIAATEHYIGSR